MTKKNGVVGTLVAGAPAAVRIVRLGNGAEGQIENSIAVGSHGEAYVATNRRLYRLSHDAAGLPVVDWSVRLSNSGGAVKPGQIDQGSGTTPYLHGGHRLRRDHRQR